MSSRFRRPALMKQKRTFVMDQTVFVQSFSKTFILGIFLTITILFYVWTRVEVVQLNYSILEMSKKEKELLMKSEHIKEELATLISPSRLSTLAKDQLHLKDPKQNQIIYMK